MRQTIKVASATLSFMDSFFAAVYIYKAQQM